MRGKLICNVCGKTFDALDESENFSIYQTMGYGIGDYDTSKLELDICCECMAKIIGGCKVSPVISHHDEAPNTYRNYEVKTVLFGNKED